MLPNDKRVHFGLWEKKSCIGDYDQSVQFQFLNKRERERERESQISETQQQVNKKTKTKNSVARRIKRKEEQIEANLNEDQRRVASKQRRML